MTQTRWWQLLSLMQGWADRLGVWAAGAALLWLGSASVPWLAALMLAVAGATAGTAVICHMLSFFCTYMTFGGDE